jgi:hypothetical protein
MTLINISLTKIDTLASQIIAGGGEVTVKDMSVMNTKLDLSRTGALLRRSVMPFMPQ